MSDTAARLLRLLALLQTPRGWSGAELAERLAVGSRTIRRDGEKLRTLGYPVHAVPGIAGYRLGGGVAMPPLLLDDDEAVAIAIGLGTAAGNPVAGIEESSVRALAKLDQVLPARLRHRVRALRAATVSIPAGSRSVDPDTVSAIAAACQRHERLRFDYVAHDGTPSVRDCEPLRLVHSGRHWYLVAWDVERAGWRNFRVGRLRLRIPNGPRFVPRDPPGDDLANYTAQGISHRAYRYRGRFTVHAPIAEAASRRPSAPWRRSTPPPACCGPARTRSTSWPSSSRRSGWPSRCTSHRSWSRTCPRWRPACGTLWPSAHRR